MKAKDLKKAQPPKILIYGPHGTGKTGVLAQASGGFLADSDKGMRTALNLTDQWTKYRHEIEFTQFLELDPKKPNSWVKFKELVFKINREIKAGTWKYDAFCIDSLTNFGLAAMQNVLFFASREKAQLQDWGAAIDDMRMILRLITSWPVLVLVATHENPFEDLNGNILMLKPKTLGNKLCDEVCCMFDEVWHTSCKRRGSTISLEVSWEPSNLHETCTRSGQWKTFDLTKVGLRELLKEVGYEYTHTV